MIVHDLNRTRAVRRPDEADAVSVIDTNAVLPFAIAEKRLKPIARRDPEVVHP